MALVLTTYRTVEGNEEAPAVELLQLPLLEPVATVVGG